MGNGFYTAQINYMNISVHIRDAHRYISVWLFVKCFTDIDLQWWNNFRHVTKYYIQLDTLYICIFLFMNSVYDVLSLIVQLCSGDESATVQ